MADISLMGATFYGVPAVELPTAGGGTSTFYEVGGSETFTQNGTYDVSALAQAVVNVAGGGGGGLEYETGTWTPASDIARGSISYAKTHTNLPFIIILNDTGASSAIPSANSNAQMIYMCHASLDGTVYLQATSGSTLRYGNVWAFYVNSSASSITNTTISLTNSPDAGSSNFSYPRYWTTESEFYPSSNSTTRYWRAGRTYKWTAVWKP